MNKTRWAKSANSSRSKYLRIRQKTNSNRKKRKSERTEVLVHILSSLKIEANESIVEPVGAFQKRHVGLPQQAVVVTHENRIHSHLIRLLLPARNVNHNEKNFEFVKWPLVNYTNWHKSLEDRVATQAIDEHTPSDVEARQGNYSHSPVDCLKSSPRSYCLVCSYPRMDGGSRSSNSLNSGYSWSIFEEKAREHGMFQ